MRTTLTIDDDLAKALKERAFRSGKSFKAVVNEALRSGLNDDAPRRKKTRHQTKATALGQPAVDLKKALSIAGELEDEAILAKLELRK